jgi:prepilin-type N-terminal cleavage/methylation domain-containing protein
MLNRNVIRRRALAGFSLIEVMIAVVVLSIGLLALAALQTGIMRSSAQSKAQSVALSLAKESIEQLRGGRQFLTVADYVAIDGVEAADAEKVTIGGVDFSVWHEVTRYAYDTDASDPADPPAFKVVGNTAALGASYANGVDFKRIEVHVDWVDATGASQRVTLEDAISGLSPGNTARVARKRPDSGARGPKVVIVNPALEDGVIPIAIGDGSETAATNPRPTVVGNKGTPIQETTFDIYTYSALTEDTSQAQARVETVIVGCKCDKGRKDADAIAMRPTYWTGNRYVAPEQAGQPLAGEADVKKDKILQSDLCPVCCRDHHDAGSTGPKFSPRRETHSHHLNSDGEATGEYFDACRLIRVDGFFRVAADPYIEYYNLLETADSFKLPPPAEPAQKKYQDFVINYLDTQFTERTDNYNTSLTDVVADKLADDAALKVSQITVDPGDERWLHSRGLYVDWLEEQALAAIANAKANCPKDTPKSQCVLRVVPFTSINLTEVAAWKPFNATVFDAEGEPVNDFSVISVSRNNFVDALTSNVPVRGKVLAKNKGMTNATAESRRTNTGLLGGVDFVINPDEKAPRVANQLFKVGGAACGNTYPPTLIGPNGTASSDSESPCPAPSEAGLDIRVTITLNIVDGVVLQLYLIPPGGTAPGHLFATTTEGATQHSGSYTLSGVPYVAGTWTLHVERDSAVLGNKNLSFAWSAQPATGVEYTVSLADYEFAAQENAYPGISVVPAAICNWATGGNPALCSATNTAVNTVLTLGSYNYSDDDVYESVLCKKKSSDTTGETCANITGPVCRNFRVVSAENGTEEGSVQAILGTDGKRSERTPIKFASGIANGDAIKIIMDEDAASKAQCLYKGGKNTACNEGQQIWTDPCAE